MTTTETDPTPAPARVESDALAVLMVEDSEHDRRFFSRVLDPFRDEFRVSFRDDPAAALELLRTEKFDLLVADLNMPGMSGIELVREARDLLEDTGVLILTGSRSPEAVAEAVRLRILDYIFKEPREALREGLVAQLRAAGRQIRLMRENRRLAEELRLRLAFMEEVYRQLPDAVFAAIDPYGRVVELRGGLAGGACGRVDPVGRPVADVLREHSAEIAEAVDDLIALGEPVRNQYIETSSPEGPKVCLASLTPFEGAIVPPGAAGRVAPPRWILALRDVTPERVAATPESADFHGLVGRDPAVAGVCELIRRVAPLPVSVLITGPTGAGKDVVARAIHAESDRRGKPYIAVNCTALSSEILESELFGHVRGAFTGAVAPRKGRFREADGGTLFLDEIGDTTESFQAKLLRALDSGQIEPVGQDRPVQVDVRILCATNRDLPRLVREGRFREDLFFRINVVHLEVPPLASRPGDLPVLIEHFRREFNSRFRKSIRFVSREAMRALMDYPWPGNVRELRHTLERAFVVADGPMIGLDDLPPSVTGRQGTTRIAEPARTAATVPSAPSEPVPRRAEAQASATSAAAPPTPEPLAAEDEPARIRAALEASRGNIGDAAKALAMHRTTLWRKMKQHDIEP